MSVKLTEESGSQFNTQLKIASDAVVVVHAILRGNITVGSNTVIHPKARIDAKDGKIVFGMHNIVEETAVIENLGPSGSVMEIGNDNLFEIGSVCQACKVGDNNVFGIKCYVGQGVEITEGCRISAKCQVLSQEKLPPQTVVYFEQNLRKTSLEKPANQRSQTDFLRKLIPNFSNIIQNASKN